MEKRVKKSVSFSRSRRLSGSSRSCQGDQLVVLFVTDIRGRERNPHDVKHFWIRIRRFPAALIGLGLDPSALRPQAAAGCRWDLFPHPCKKNKNKTNCRHWLPGYCWKDAVCRCAYVTRFFFLQLLCTAPCPLSVKPAAVGFLIHFPSSDSTPHLYVFFWNLKYLLLANM